MTTAEHGDLQLPSVGQTLDGRFEIRAELGEGGMGHVFRAYDRSAGCEVALKLLIPRYLGRPERELRLFREAELGQRAQHPHLVRYLESGRLGRRGWPFLVMELIDGRDLAMRLVEGPLPGRLATVVTRQVAGAVRALHRAGVVHRDVTAMNVLMQGDCATLIDLSHAGDLSLPRGPVGSPGRITRLNEVPGTHHYMSREQANADPADPTMDVYALGITIVHMLTGRAPHGYGREAFIEMQRRGLIESPRIDHRVFSEAPLPLIELAHACVRQAADERPTMEQVVEMLDGLLAAMVMPAESTEPLGPANDTSRPRERDPDAPRPRVRRVPVSTPKTEVPESVEQLAEGEDEEEQEAAPGRPGGAPEQSPAASPSSGSQRRLLVILAVLLMVSVGIVVVLLIMLSKERSEEPAAEPSAVVEPELEPEPPRSSRSEEPRVEGRPAAEQPGPEQPGPGGSHAQPEAEPPSAPAPQVEQPQVEQPRKPPKRRSKPAKVRRPPPSPRVDCGGAPDEAKAAARARNWTQVLRLTRSRDCWDDNASRVRLRVGALAQLRRYAECAALAQTVDDLETNRAGRSCAAAIEASTP